MSTFLLIAGVATGAIVWWAWERRHRRTRAVSGGYHREITLPHADQLELYHNAFSLCSKKVRVCLAELGLPYASHEIDLIETGSYETLSRRFLAVNPEGTVPVLVHEGHPIYQSHDQIRWAADHAAPGAPALVPASPEGEAAMQHWVDCASIIGDDPLTATRESAGACTAGLTVPLFAAMITDIPAWRIVEGLLFHRLRARPLAFLGMKLTGGVRRLARVKPAAAVVQASLRHMGAHLDALERQLEASGGPWILGEQFTLADVSWMVIFDRLGEQDATHVFLGDGRRPAVTAYWERLRQRASYASAVDAYRHPTVTRGTARLRAAKEADAALRRLLEGAPQARETPTIGGSTRATPRAAP